MGAAHHAGAGAVGVGLALGQQLGGQRACRGALAGPAGPVEQVGVRGPRGRAQRRRQHRARVRMSFELSEHQIRS